MEPWLQNLIEHLDDSGEFNGWTGLNIPGDIERESGLWLTKAGIRHFVSKGFEYDPNRQPTHFEWGAVTEGEMTLDTGGRSILLQRGMFYLMPGDVQLKARMTGSPLLVWFEFSGKLSSAILPLLGGEPGIVSTGDFTYGQIRTVLQMAYVLQTHPTGFALAAHSLLWRFLTETSGAMAWRSQTLSAEIRQAVQHIRSLPMNRKVSVTQLAAQVRMSVETFRKKFHVETGEAPIQYLLHYRITRAKEMMGDHRLSIKQIAHETGFPDPYYFSRLFKQYEGVSPLAFRKEMYPDDQVD